jgi:hypothetical protein
LSSILFDEYKGVMKPLASERWWMLLSFGEYMIVMCYLYM